MKKFFLLAATFFAMVIGAKAASTTVTVPSITDAGTIAPVSGTSYYLYDVSKGMFLGRISDGGILTNSTSSMVTLTPASTSTYYTFTSSVNTSKYLKSGYYKYYNLWWDGASTDAVSQWYITSSANGCTLDVGATDKSTTAGTKTRSDAQKMYLYYNSNSYLDFTTDATAADEFLFVVSSDYSSFEKTAAKIYLAKVINVAASANYDNADAVTTFNNSSATTADYTSAASTLLSNVLTNCTNVDVTSLYLGNNNFSAGTSSYWMRINATASFANSIATCTSTGNFWTYYKGITLPAGIYTFSMDALDDNASAQVYISQSVTGNPPKITKNVTAGTETGSLVTTGVTVSIESSAAVDMGIQRSGATGTWVKMTNAKLVYVGAASAQAISDANATNDIIPCISGGTLTITRSLAADKYNAVVLPVALTATEITTMFGTDATVATMTSATDAGVLTFAKATTTTAGVPFLVKTSNSSISAVQLTNQIVLPSITSVTNNGITFTGTYNKITGADAEGLYFISGDKIYKGTSKSTINPMRGYFTISNGSAAKELTFMMDDGSGDVTKINQVEGVDAAVSSESVFNMAGQRVNSQRLSKGVYIKNGKKFIVK